MLNNNILEYKGTFNVHISPELHKQLVNVELKNGTL